MTTRAPRTAPESPIPIALAAVFAGIAVLTTMLAVAYRTPVPLAVAAPFGLSASLVWYHATGRLHRRLRRGAVPGGHLGGGRERTVGDRGRRARGGGGVGDRERGARDPRANPADGEWRARADASGPFDGRARAESRRHRSASDRHRSASDGWGRQPPTDHDAPTRAEAYETLDLDPGADAEAVRAAYRRKVKEVHPDVEGGDEAAFREVTAAYDRLSE